MATLNELRTIYTNAIGFADAGAPTQAELDAHALLDRCETHLWRRANALMSQDDTTPNLQNIKLALRITMESRDIGRRMLIILLGSDAAAAATVQQILATNDTAVATAIDAIAARFALGLVQPGVR